MRKNEIMSLTWSKVDLKARMIRLEAKDTFNTNMRKSWVSDSVIMAITGHSTREMFDRYNTIDEQDAHDAVDRFQDFIGNVDQTVDKTQISN